MTRNVAVVLAIFVLAYLVRRGFEEELPPPPDPAAEAGLRKVLQLAGVDLDAKIREGIRRLYIEKWWAVGLAVAAMFVLAGLAFKK